MKSSSMRRFMRQLTFWYCLRCACSHLIQFMFLLSCLWYDQFRLALTLGAKHLGQTWLGFGRVGVPARCGEAGQRMWRGHTVFFAMQKVDEIGATCACFN